MNDGRPTESSSKLVGRDGDAATHLRHVRRHRQTAAEFLFTHSETILNKTCNSINLNFTSIDHIFFHKHRHMIIENITNRFM